MTDVKTSKSYIVTTALKSDEVGNDPSLPRPRRDKRVVAGVADPGVVELLAAASTGLSRSSTTWICLSSSGSAFNKSLEPTPDRAALVLLTTLSMPRYSHTATLLYLNRFLCLLGEFIKPRILPNCVPPRVQT